MGGFRMSDTVVAAAPSAAQVPVSNTRELGKLMFTHYLYPLEVAAAILLVAMIAAIALTLRARKDSKYVSPGDQVRVKSKDRMVVLKMAATQAAPEPQAATEPEVK
jgi:NADH-quinone oxidoreductase subunit J